MADGSGAHPFLSDEWLTAARALREEFAGRVGAVEHEVRMNLVITEVPFGGGEALAHVDTSAGEMFVDTGHLDDADLTLTLDYTTARALLVEQDQQAAMQAFMGGRIKVQGDLTKLLVLQAQPPPPTPDAVELAARLRAITE